MSLLDMIRPSLMVIGDWSDDTCLLPCVIIWLFRVRENVRGVINLGLSAIAGQQFFFIMMSSWKDLITVAETWLVSFFTLQINGGSNLQSISEKSMYSENVDYK